MAIPLNNEKQNEYSLEDYRAVADQILAGGGATKIFIDGVVSNLIIASMLEGEPIEEDKERVRKLNLLKEKAPTDLPDWVTKPNTQTCKKLKIKRPNIAFRVTLWIAGAGILGYIFRNLSHDEAGGLGFIVGFFLILTTMGEYEKKNRIETLEEENEKLHAKLHDFLMEENKL